MKKILIPVHTNFEETELITTINILKRNKIDYYLWSIEGITTVKSSHEAIVETESSFPTNEIFDGIFFPGGEAVKDLMEYDEIIRLTKKFNDENKIISAICSAPLILKKAGILEKKKYTSFSNLDNMEESTNENVEVDGNIITGKDYTSTIEFANKIVELI